MPMTDDVAALRIQRDLHAAENLIDQAMAAVASLAATLLEARVETATPSSTGHETLLRLTKAQSSLVSTRGDLLRVHGELIDIAQIKMMPDIHPDCPTLAQGAAIHTIAA